MSYKIQLVAYVAGRKGQIDTFAFEYCHTLGFYRQTQDINSITVHFSGLSGGRRGIRTPGTVTRTTV